VCESKPFRRAIAEELAQLGAHVWICARTKHDLERCLDEYKGATWTKGGRIDGSVCDVSVAEEREELMRRVAARFSSKLDILVRKNRKILLKTRENYPKDAYQSYKFLSNAYRKSDISQITA
jgi:Tropinone reductase 1